ncbi:KDEL motif-containing protein 1, partial [Tetrabaena socialis]
CRGQTPNATTPEHHCSRYHAFGPGIEEGLLLWHDDEGISERLIERTIRERSLQARVPGLPLAILGGQLYVINGRAQALANAMPWQADNLVVYAHALRSLVARWGTALPDVELVIESADVPTQDLAEPAAAAAPGQAEPDAWGDPHGRLPVMRHCKTASSPDILIPTFHFYTMHFDTDFLAAADRFERDNPWSAKLPAAFGAGTSYHRQQGSPSTTKAWDGKNRGTTVKMLRSGFSEYLSAELRHPHINYASGSVPISEWGRFQMVMHLDGISCSSRLWQLLALGSVVLREQSGYYAFYDKLLTRFVHFVPFWSHRPREVVWAFNWVRANQEAAEGIASRGQMFAREYLNRQAVECYWLMLLGRYARLQRFKPGVRSGAGAANGTGGGSTQPGSGELLPIDAWLAAQDGTVNGWPPDHAVNRFKDLNLIK